MLCVEDCCKQSDVEKEGSRVVPDAGGKSEKTTNRGARLKLHVGETACFSCISSEPICRRQYRASSVLLRAKRRGSSLAPEIFQA